MSFILVENTLLSLIAAVLSIIFSNKAAIIFVIIDLSLAMITNLPYILGQASLPYKQDVFGGEFPLRLNLGIILIYLIIWASVSFVYLGKYNFYGDEK